MRTISLLVATCLTFTCLLPAAAQERESSINDQAGFFSPDTEKVANDQIVQLERKHKLQVHVETVKSVPADDVERVKGMSAAQRGEYFANWLKTLAAEEKVKGLFVLICREPSHLRIGVSKELHNRGFRDSDRNAIVDQLTAAFKKKEYDRGLLNSLDTIRTTAERRLAGAAAPAGTQHTEPAPVQSDYSLGLTGWLCVGLAGIAALVALVSVVGMLFRGMSGGGGGAAGPGYGGGMGGGMGGGLLGGLLSGFGGAMLGNWMYDQFSGGRSAHADDHTASHGDNAGSTTNDDNYQDFSSGGSDFGGGDDFGGGGDGGGDF